MPATNFIFDKRRSSRKRFRMGHRHDDDANGTARESRHLVNPYEDWDEAANDRLLAKIENEHPLTESIEEEEEGFQVHEDNDDSSMNVTNQYYDFSKTNTTTTTTATSHTSPLQNADKSETLPSANNNTQTSPPGHLMDRSNSNRSSSSSTGSSSSLSSSNSNNGANETKTTNQQTTHNITTTTINDNENTDINATILRQHEHKNNFAILPDGKFDHVFERKIRNLINLLLNNHVKSEQIDCNDRSMYTGLPGITSLYHHLISKQYIDSKLRDQLAAKVGNHINQYMTMISSQHMHNTKCASFLCGELGIIALCALTKTQQRLHKEMLTRTLSYPGPGTVLSQSAPSTPGILGAELISSGQATTNAAHLQQHVNNITATRNSIIEPINSHINEPDTNKLLEKILELIRIQENQGTPDELLYGRTGGLYAMLLIRQQLPKQTIIKDEHISQHINLMLKSGQTMESFGRPLFYSWHGKEYIGAAHGYSGILYMLLEAHKYLSQDQLKLIREAINFVQTIRYPSCNYPSSVGSQTDRLVHWCHGAPGVIHMLIKAYQVYREPSLLESALACGELIWQRGLLKKGFSLCHGISGNAYAFLHLYQLTRDRKHLYRAGKFAQFYLDHASLINWRADSPASLFEGYAGLAYFLADLLSPCEAKFPAFQLTTSTQVEVLPILEST